MYHLFETEMNSVSAFNNQSLWWFSLGSFWTNCIIAILIGWAYNSSPLSEFGQFMVHKAVWYAGVLALACYTFGWSTLWTKRTLINQIKDETRTDELPPDST